MHDPMTVAFELKYPWRKYGRKGITAFDKTYRESWATIWHVDPERDGSDDSCGWFSPKLTKEQRDGMKNLAWDEARTPYFKANPTKEGPDPVTAEVLLRQAMYNVGAILHRRSGVKQPTFMECAEWTTEMLANSHDNFRTALCFVPGWHSNHTEDRESDRQHEAEGFFCSLARFILRERRPWYRKPRWHVHHWKLQLHPLQKFKRWAFSRCEGCKRGFKWGYSPVSMQWGGHGPRWFRSEEKTYHSECAPGCTPAQAESEQLVAQ